jgi:hypothetical protein
METKDIRLENLLALATGSKVADFCQKIDISTSYFSQIKHRRKNIGDDIARKVEERLGLPNGYMDTPKSVQGTGEAANGISAETLGIACAIETLPRPIRDSLSRLVYNLAADVASRSGEPTIDSFSMEITKNEQRPAVQEARRAKG